MNLSNLQEKFLSDRLSQLGFGDKIVSVQDIIKELFKNSPSLNELSDDLLLKIWSFLPDKDDLKLRCMLMVCCKRWKDLLDSKKEISVSQNDIMSHNIKKSLLIKLGFNIETMILILDFKPRFFRSKWITDFITNFPKLKSLTLITWSIFRETDINRLSNIGNLRRLEIVGGNNNRTMFFMDKKHKDSSKLDRITIGYTSAMDPTKNYPDLDFLIFEKYMHDYNRWNWYHGEICVCKSIYNYSNNYCEWIKSCSKIHIVNNNDLLYDINHNGDILKSAISLQNTDYFCDRSAMMTMSDISELISIYTSLKYLKIKNLKKNEEIYFRDSWNFDHIEIHSKHPLHLSCKFPLSITHYQFNSSDITFEKDDNMENNFMIKYVYENKKLSSLSFIRKNKFRLLCD